MTADDSELLRETRDKTLAALRLLIASLDAYVPFDPTARETLIKSTAS